MLFLSPQCHSRVSTAATGTAALGSSAYCSTESSSLPEDSEVISTAAADVVAIQETENNNPSTMSRERMDIFASLLFLADILAGKQVMPLLIFSPDRSTYALTCLCIIVIAVVAAHRLRS